ncbi:Osmolarity sensor protein EnvZ [Alphaproteobacteria bacterium SO-S41]|nr:Osmolarity sensor protein EnvZ [Alphaproteobacteria bacterium SO-S41]
MSLTSDRPAVLPTSPPRRRRGARLRDFLPRRLFVRSLLIVVVPMVLLQAVVAYMFLADHEARTTANLTRGQVDQMALVIQLVQGEPDPAKRHELVAEASGRLGMSVAYLPGEQLPTQPGTTDTQVGEYIGREMDGRIPEPHWYDAQRFGELVDLRVKVDEAGVLRFLIERKRFININMHLLPIWMIVFSLFLLGIAILFLRNQIRPIQRLALAAEAFGRGRDVPDFKPAGATEVRRAAIAFIGMRQRIARQMAQRTEMLAGVSHDLRTPLTRMKLELAMMGDEPCTADLRNDILEMERMLDEYLAFARGEGGEQAANANVAELVSEIADDVRRKGDFRIDVTTVGDLVAPVKRNALKRCVVNLVENAIKYGKRTQLAARRDEDYIEIFVEDDGPGIPAERRQEAFRPFRRLDEGRNLAAGGVGLGLAIARDIARGHGGDVKLGESALGGLKATVRIPV